MIVTTFNMNGVRSASGKGFWNWAQQLQPDILCLQEIRANEAQFPEESALPGYKRYIQSAEKPGYSGVAIYSRIPGTFSVPRLDHPELDTEGRWLEIETEDCYVNSIYFPSGSSGALRQQLKMAFLERFEGLWETQFKHRDKPTLFCGDFNIAHHEIDIKNWKSNQKNSGFLPEERAWLTRLQNDFRLSDAYRILHPEKIEYTWWSTRANARGNNVGWRIDYQWISAPDRLKPIECRVEKDPIFSDHAPFTVTYKKAQS